MHVTPKMIKIAGSYLTNSDNSLSTQVGLILGFKGDDTTIIDNIEGVDVCQFIENKLTVRFFRAMMPDQVIKKTQDRVEFEVALSFDRDINKADIASVQEELLEAIRNHAQVLGFGWADELKALSFDVYCDDTGIGLNSDTLER